MPNHPFPKINTIALILVVFLCGCASDKSVYEAFRAYRIALDEEPEKAVSYFYRENVDRWVNDVSLTDFPDNLDQIWRIRYLVHSGERVQRVHRYSVESQGVSAYRLIVYFSNEESVGLEKMGYEFKLVDGKLFIQFVDFYTLPDTFGDIPESIIDEFDSHD